MFESVQIGYDKKVYREHNRKYREDKKEEKNKDIVLAPVKLPVLLNVKEGKKRSVGGTFFYSTDQGLGAEASWEHRNLFGNGEILKLSVPLKDEELYLAANFKNPLSDTENRILSSVPVRGMKRRTRIIKSLRNSDLVLKGKSTRNGGWRA